MKTTSLLKKSFWVFFFALFFAVQAFAGDDFSGSCLTLGEYMEKGTGDNFILKDAFETIAKACSNLALFSWDFFAVPLQAIVGLGAAIYIAMYTLKNIGAFSQQDVFAYLSNEKTGVIPLAVKLAIVVWLLAHQEFLYKYLISTVINTGAEIGGRGMNFDTADDVDTLFKQVFGYIKTFNDSLYKIIATGQLLLCMAFLPDGILDWYWIVIPFGAALYIYGWMLVIGVSFYMLDVVFRLAIGCILLPFAVACGISKFTSGYTRKTWNLFINVCFNFIVLGIVIDFTTAMISLCVAVDIPKDQVLTKADIETLAQNLGIKDYVVTSLCCMISFQLFMQLEQLVDKISGSSSVGSVGREIGGIAGKTAIGVASAPLKKGGKIGGAVMQKAGSSVGRGVRRIGNRISQSAPYRTVAQSRVARGVNRFYQGARHVLRLDER